jgi:hypothetical protein
MPGAKKTNVFVAGSPTTAMFDPPKLIFPFASGETGPPPVSPVRVIELNGLGGNGLQPNTIFYSYVKELEKFIKNLIH